MLGILAFTLLPGSPWQHRRFKSPRAIVHSGWLVSEHMNTVRSVRSVRHEQTNKSHRVNKQAH